ncbi:MAG TPA: Gfo/Idh/MocA family oxidoreductase [Candidatus Acidoferrum sp.]|jgi:predicted dehydrogenase|nr:Gfo/Idh/MocA family oxidoreductase [Candidatus Acidoferrum sp.]
MKNSTLNSGMTRRHFLAASGLALVAPTIIPASALGQGNTPAPSERITLGVVGWGMQGPSNTGAFLGLKECQVVGACDLDKNHLQSAVNTVNGHYKNQDCKAYHDYREMMARKDIDAVMLAVPDTWHALTATEAANNKKDIYGEKPLARTIAEQQAIVKAVQKNNRIWQTGSWQRSQAPFRKAAEIVRNGLIGKVTRVEVGLPDGHTDFAGTSKALLNKLAVLPEKPNDLSKVVAGTPAWDLAVTPPPDELDYERWIGPSKMEPYIQARVHMNWRWNYNVGGGQLLDWIGHHCDIAHWGLDCDQTGGPLEIEGSGQFPSKDAIWNTCGRYRITCKYPNDITMIIAGGHSDIRSGTKWIGTDGWVWVDRNGFDASNLDWFRQIPPEQYKVKLYRSDNHQKNFLDCVKSRKPTITPAETGHHSAIPGHLGLIAMMVGRKIKWDSTNEVIVGDEEASKLLSRPYRTPWALA